ncbi:N-acetylmuramic acid 6-phosphate etherase [Colwellia sp.]|uniref:N-acetylmuramic acid 6-phosphate etherase n=1 Tax=Colwellia sp. TaxID=56799 RepID=UPI0025BD023F|nr:N-acetylmuramic acid 6-phosphate etherase [Colwellia sp.]
MIGGLNYANKLGCTTASVTCIPGAISSQIADIAICAFVGPEALTGSIRMKSGIAQKFMLNMLSTASMSHWGKIYQNLIVDVNASNDKLYARASKIVMPAENCPHHVAKSALEQANYNAKLAILMILTGKDAKTAQQLLDNNNGFLRQAIG